MKKEEGTAIGTILSKEQSDYFKGYINRLTETMRLRDWNITIDFTKVPSDGAYAENSQFGHSKHSELRFAEVFLQLTPTQQTQVILHELVHCYLFEVHTCSIDGFSCVGGAKASYVFEASITAQVELATDAIADGLTPLVEQFALPATEFFELPVATTSWDSNKVLVVNANNM